ncbi:uncharacterized protein DS421_17g579400 [Arachis hypogaea]|nr:uncharacterized protein DS421_17g579400 [Arachis hypogaea]
MNKKYRFLLQGIFCYSLNYSKSYTEHPAYASDFLKSPPSQTSCSQEFLFLHHHHYNSEFSCTKHSY